MNKLLSKIHQQAKKIQARIIFPECHDLRVLKALEEITKNRICQPVLIGNQVLIIQKSLQNKLKIDFSLCQFIDPSDTKLQKKFANQFFKLRGADKTSLSEAAKLMTDLNYFGAMCLKNNLGDGIVSGSASATADTIRPAFQIIGTQKKFKRASGCFLMILPNKSFLFADCAVNPEPDAELLAAIALETAETAKMLDLVPKIAMLSFSSNSSASHPLVEKVHQATALIHKKNPQLSCDGEMQADAALVPEIAKYKFPKSTIQGNANILIFPNLEAGNISYKLVERLANAQAIGTIIQGLKKPVNDLSRGCSAEDIIHLTAITALQTKPIN